MGIIILPFILIALIAFIISVVILFKSLLKKELNPKNFLIGTITSISIYFLIFLDYKTSESAYALGTYFMFPFFLILIPDSADLQSVSTTKRKGVLFGIPSILVR